MIDQKVEIFMISYIHRPKSFMCVIYIYIYRPDLLLFFKKIIPDIGYY